jgi:hypothetical protein
VRGGLSKALLDQKNLFTDLGKAGERLSRVLNNEVTRATDNLDKKLEQVNRHLNKAIEVHERYRQKLANIPKGRFDFAAAEGDERNAFDMVQRLAVRSASMTGERTAMAAGGGGSGNIFTRNLLGSGGSGMGGQLLQALGLGGMARYAGPLGVGLYGASAITNHFRDRQRQQNYSVDMQAETGQAVGPAAISLAQGDMATAFGMHQMLGTKQGREDLTTLLGNVRNRAGIDAFLGVIKKGTIGLNPSGAAFDAASALGDLGSINVEAKKAMMEQLQKTLQGSPMDVFQMQMAQQFAPQHVGTARALGSRSDVNYTIKNAARFGVSDTEIAGIATSIADTAGRSASRRLRDAAASAFAGGLSNAGGIAGATALDESILPRLAGTGLDVRAVLPMLGQAVASGMGPSSMTMTGADRLGMLGSGINPSMDSAMQVRLTQQNLRGDQALGQMFAGHDPYQKSINLISAIDALGPGSSIYAQNLLATGLSDTNTLSAVMNGKVPSYFRSAGISAGDAKKASDNILRSMLNRVVMDEGTANTPMGKAAADAMGSSDLRGFLRKSKRGLHDLAPLISQSNPELGLSPADAEGFLRDVAGLGSGRGKEGKFGDGAGGSVDLELMKKQFEMAANHFNQMTDAMSGFNGQAPQVLQNFETFFKMLMAAAGLHSTAEGAMRLDTDAPSHHVAGPAWDVNDSSRPINFR